MGMMKRIRDQKTLGLLPKSPNRWIKKNREVAGYALPIKVAAEARPKRADAKKFQKALS